MPAPKIPEKWRVKIAKPEDTTAKLPTSDLYYQGQRATLPEYNVGMGLTRLKIAHDFQYPIEGGRALRGGQMLDFLAYTVPMQTPIYVQGDYWHGSKQKIEKDKWMMTRVRKALDYKCVDPVEIWEHEALTIDDAIAAIKRKLHI